MRDTSGGKVGGKVKKKPSTSLFCEFSENVSTKMKIFGQGQTVYPAQKKFTETTQTKQNHTVPSIFGFCFFVSVHPWS